MLLIIGLIVGGLTWLSSDKTYKQKDVDTYVQEYKESKSVDKTNKPTKKVDKPKITETRKTTQVNNTFNYKASSTKKVNKEEIVFKKFKSKCYFVYRYTFSDGMIYIGRSHNKNDRYGNMWKYEGQTVFEHMKRNPSFKREVIFFSTNLYDVAKKEHELIVATYDYNLNECKEYNWKEKVDKYLAEQEANQKKYKRKY